MSLSDAELAALAQISAFLGCGTSPINPEGIREYLRLLQEKGLDVEKLYRLAFDVAHLALHGATIPPYEAVKP